MTMSDTKQVQVQYQCNGDFTTSNGVKYSEGDTIPQEQYDTLTSMDQDNFDLVDQDALLTEEETGSGSDDDDATGDDEAAEELAEAFGGDDN